MILVWASTHFIWVKHRLTHSFQVMQQPTWPASIREVLGEVRAAMLLSTCPTPLVSLLVPVGDAWWRVIHSDVGWKEEWTTLADWRSYVGGSGREKLLCTPPWLHTARPPYFLCYAPPLHCSSHFPDAMYHCTVAPLRHLLAQSILCTHCRIAAWRIDR